MQGETGRVAARVRELLGDPGPDVADVPDAPRRSWLRLDPGRRAALAVGLAVAVAATATGVWLAADRPRAVAVAQASGTPPRSTPSSAVARPSPAPAAAPVVVDVVGKVAHPGLYRLPSGARVDDAVRAAGGPLHGTDLTSLNLAARVSDGQQILVGVAASMASQGVSGGSGAAGSGAPVNLNSATLEQLESLPGVGPVLAQHILEWRDAHGGFHSVDQLNDVSGIGPAKYADLKGRVTL